MDFNDFKKRYPYPKADTRNPWMGMNGKVCENPAYWCRLHEIWLSEEDVEKKKCSNKMSYDMLSTYKCKCLERKEINPFVRDYI